MPARNKRPYDFDPNQSDPEDEDFDVSTTRPARTKSSKSQRSKTKVHKKRKRTGDEDDDGSDNISDSEGSEDFLDSSVKEESEPEIDENTGRPIRAAKKKRVTYNEDSDEEEEEEDDKTPEPNLMKTPPSRKRKPEKKSLVVKLAANPQTRRTLRDRSLSLSHGSKRPPSAVTTGFTRRSSRLTHDDTDPIIALTDSGRHAEIIRPGTRSPEVSVQRAMKGGKGLKHPPPSFITEETEEGRDPPAAVLPQEVGFGEESHTSRFAQELEVAASGEDLGDEEDATIEVAEHVAEEKLHNSGSSSRRRENHDEEMVIPESQEGPRTLTDVGEEAKDDADAEVEEEEDDDMPIKTRRISSRQQELTLTVDEPRSSRSSRRMTRASQQDRSARGSQRGRRNGQEESSDFEPAAEEAGEENVSDSAASQSSPQKSPEHEESESTSNRRSRRLGMRPNSRKRKASEDHDSEVAEELQEELQELRGSRPKRQRREEPGFLYDGKPNTRVRKPVDYRIIRPDLAVPVEEDNDEPTVTPSKRGQRAGGGGTWQRSLFNTYGPFGGGGGLPPVLGGPGGVGATGGVDSDSSDDENVQRPKGGQGVGGMMGMTPTSAAPPNLGLFQPAQTHNADALQTSLGRVKDKAALADADPVGVDQNVNFDNVGGLRGHIDQLKEMVTLPLLYPEIFMRFHVTPPRGVLFHGPPGTGKTLLARALASTVSSHGKKVTFYMRKGADALSKWVGEAEKQLRLLFEEARKNQPSIIFFDEIDGLAPVRSSKQEQIHASIVSTLLALMDGMDGRGQVIVIGATNRPDSIDPALRRPGRFDREFYFPLPSVTDRREILNIHTKGWDPPVPEDLKDELAEVTKGYGGADLRALCTEAALNAVQRRYPQIYQASEKLQIRPETIHVTAKDFMISVKKIIPSSQRSVSSGANPLPKQIEPLLRQPLAEIQNAVGEALPQKKPSTALEEAMFEDATSNRGMKTERMHQEFERFRVFRPRLLIYGDHGMGQQYLAAALLHHFEGLHVQSFDLPTLLGDAAKSPEATLVQLFTEVRRHKPSVIYIPSVESWFATVGETVISVFRGLLRSLAPTDPVLLLGVLEGPQDLVEPHIVKDFFGYSRRNQYLIVKPIKQSRREFFRSIIDYLRTAPADFPDPTDRKQRVLEVLPPVPPEAPKPPPPPSKAELKAQKRKDRLNLNILKQRIQPIMEQIKLKYKKFRTGVIDESQIRYLYEEQDPDLLTSDAPLNVRGQFRPYERGTDDQGHECLIEAASGKIVYNMEIVTIEKRLSNGYYKRPKDYLADIKKLTKDAKAMNDQERLLKANELQTNVEVDIAQISYENPALDAEWQAIWDRENERQKTMVEQEKQLAIAEGREMVDLRSNVPPPAHESKSTEDASGPVILGQPLPNASRTFPVTPQSRNPVPQEPGSNPSDPSQRSSLTNGYAAGVSDLSGDLNNPNGHSSSNGTSVPSRHDNLQNSNSTGATGGSHATDGSSFGPSAQERPHWSSTGGPASLAHRLSYPHSLSQRSAITPLAEGSNPGMYTNDASTTSSDKRNTNSSGPQTTQSQPNGTVNNTQNSEGPDYRFLPQAPQLTSTLRATQDTSGSSQALSQHEQMQLLEYEAAFPSQGSPTDQQQLRQRQMQMQMHAPGHSSSQGQDSNPRSHSGSQATPPVPPFGGVTGATSKAAPPPHNSNINLLLNSDDRTAAPSNAVTAPSTASGAGALSKLRVDDEQIEHFVRDLVDLTSACSIEQLEQVHSAVMAEIWRSRGEWDRRKVVEGCRGAMEEVLQDVEVMQGWGAERSNGAL